MFYKYYVCPCYIQKGIKNIGIVNVTLSVSDESPPVTFFANESQTVTPSVGDLSKPVTFSITAHDSDNFDCFTTSTS